MALLTLSGLLGDFLTAFTGSLASPFIASVVFLMICFAFTLQWSENYGENSSETSLGMLIRTALKEATDRNVLALGSAQSLFEASMYVFVFAWTPALEESWQGAPLGIVFALFMVAIMIGSQIFTRLSIPLSMTLALNCLVACIILFVPIHASVSDVHSRDL